MEQTTPISTTMRAVVKQVQACCLLVCDCMTGQEVLVHSPDACHFCVCDRVCIHYSGAMTLSLPPQITALNIRRICWNGHSCG